MWDDEEYIIYFTKKFETNNNVFLVCTKRGSKNHKWPGKPKYVKETGMLNIYEKCINNDFISHNIMNYEKFKQLYRNKNINNINFKIKKIQIYLVQYILEEKKNN
jgi:hypothetical protein